MIYLKKFANHQEYAAESSGLLLPNISVCVNEHEVHYDREHNFVPLFLF